MPTLTRAFPAVVLAASLSVGCEPTPTVETPAVELFSASAVPVYRATLTELNGSGVTAHALIQVIADQLVVTLNVVGHEPDQVHPQHIHGFASGIVSSCPPAAADTNGDGIITIAEGSAFFGPVQVDLRPYPTPENQAAATQYRRAFPLATVPFAPSDLGDKTMVVHGAFVGASYVASLPVACGVVERVN